VRMSVLHEFRPTPPLSAALWLPRLLLAGRSRFVKPALKAHADAEKERSL
jgi:hypothetical protein